MLDHSARNHPAGSLMSIVTIGVACVMFFTLLGKRDIATSHEARVAQTARQMAVSGWPWEAGASVRVQDPADRSRSIDVNPWLIPVINGSVRLEKPPLPYWCAAVMFKLFGVHEWSARFVPALLGALATLLVADLARMTLGRRATLVAAIVWITSLFIVDEFRKTMADPYLAFFTTLAVWSVVRGGRAMVWFYVAIALGVLSKGPLIFVTVAPPLIAGGACISRKRVGRRASWFPHVIGIAMFLLIAIPWPAAVVRALPYARQLWWGESVGKISEDVERARPFYTYIAHSFQLALPWTPMWIAGMVLAVLRFRNPKAPKPGWRASVRARRRAFALVWYALYVILFSCFGVKKDAYLLPVMAAQTLLITDATMLLFAWVKRSRAFKGMSAVLAFAQGAIGIGFGGAMCFMHADAPRVALAVLGVGLSVGGIWIVARSVDVWKWLATQSFAYALLVITVIGFLNADRDNARSPRRFANAVQRYSESTHVPIWRQRIPEDASFYLPLAGSDRMSERAIVIIDDNHRDIERGLVTPDAQLFAPYVGDVPIISIRRVPIDLEDSGSLRWKAFELTFNWDRM